MDRNSISPGATVGVTNKLRWFWPLALVGLAHSACTFDQGGTPLDTTADAAMMTADADPNAPDSSPMSDAGTPVDAMPQAPDARVPVVIDEDVVHVPAGDTFTGIEDLVWTGAVTVDTTALTINGTLYPMGSSMVFDSVAQEPGGPDLAVLHLASLDVQGSAVITVTGDRPFVILGDGPITVAGAINADANMDQPGPGGAAPEQGLGAGSRGNSNGGWGTDGGGGGAGYATAAAQGGRGCVGTSCFSGNDVSGGASGDAYGDSSLTELRGGAGAGHGGRAGGNLCAIGSGGAGGGAVQIYSQTSIVISGSINAGGGGGTGGGMYDGNCDNSAAGGGGGSGGAIYLQAPGVEVSGNLAANGGAGGAGADGGTADGQDGQDGLLGEQSAVGGASAGNGSGGGDGGSRSAAPEDGVTIIDVVNGGGGGGSVGRIVVNTHGGGASLSGTFSPSATETTY